MVYLKLGLALLLPWLAGWACLAALQQRLCRERCNWSLPAGYGFFLGYAGLYVCVVALSAFAPGLSAWPVIALFGVLALAGLGLQIRRADERFSLTTAAIPADTPLRFRPLLYLLSAWLVMHLCLAMVEILYKPVFPWDAWTTWIYRSKAWFLSGEMSSLVHYREWLRTTTDTVYTAPGFHYPDFASVIPLWVAQATGHWNDSFANLPVFLCITATSIAVYGTVRIAGAPHYIALIGAYILLSVPMVGTHVALAGYADIWMAGYVGLGFAALVASLTIRRWSLSLLGILLLLFAVTIKREALAWLMLAPLFVVLAMAGSRMLLSIALLTCLLALVSFATGISRIDLGSSGILGYHDGILSIPFLGDNRLQFNQAFPLLFKHAVGQGSWHLLWPYVAVSAIALYAFCKGAPSRIPGAFILLCLATLYFIFGLTEQGRWVESFSAANRVALHFVPALVVCLAMSVHWLMERAGKASVSERPSFFPLFLTVTSLGLVVTAIVISWYVTPGAGVSPKLRGFTFERPELVAGEGFVRDGIYHVNRYPGGRAIVSSGNIDLAAEHFSSLNLHLRSEGNTRAYFFWRLAEDPATIHSLDVPVDEAAFVDLGDIPDWRGRVTEAGFFIDGSGGDELAIIDVGLYPGSLAAAWRAVWRDWLFFENWNQKSVNRIVGGHGGQTVYLSLVVAGWLVASITILLIARAVGVSRGRGVAIALCLALFAWLVLDARWTVNGVRQAQNTIAHHEFLHDSCLNAHDCKLRELAKLTQDTVAEDSGRVLVVQADPVIEFPAYRMKYHLLPLSSAVYTDGDYRVPWRGRSYVLVLWSGLQGADTAHALALARTAVQNKRVILRVVAEHEEGVLVEAFRPGGARRQPSPT